MATDEEWEEVDSSESGSCDELTSAMDMEQDVATDNNNFVSRRHFGSVNPLSVCRPAVHTYRPTFGRCADMLSVCKPILCECVKHFVCVDLLCV